MHSRSPSDDHCFAIRQAARHISQLYERHLAGADITPTQFSILSALAIDPDLTMADLAEAMVMERTTLIRVLKPMLRAGLVQTAQEGPCTRKHQMSLTPAGEARLSLAAEHFKAAQEEFETRFGREQAAHLRHELLRLTRR
jgi:DNA-binding MarR family transcriptional regulator